MPAPNGQPLEHPLCWLAFERVVRQAKRVLVVHLHVASDATYGASHKFGSLALLRDPKLNGQLVSLVYLDWIRKARS